MTGLESEEYMSALQLPHQPSAHLAQSFLPYIQQRDNLIKAGSLLTLFWNNHHRDCFIQDSYHQGGVWETR